MLDEAIKSINEVPAAYSNLLQAVLKDMLVADELLRPSPSQLVPFFTKFESQLRSGKVSAEAVGSSDPDAALHGVF